MELGVPMIVPNFPFHKSVVEDNGCGLCVDPDSPQELAEAIAWPMDHPGEAAEMGRHGRNAVMQKYSWSNKFNKLLRFYADILITAPATPLDRQA
jgi:glycosyltransferase involved in cell wall biosynthesis